MKIKGFTLIELLLYLGVASTIIFSASTFFVAATGAKVKNRSVSEVEQQGEQAMYMITQAIRAADSINSPARGTSGSSLSLAFSDASKNPTIINLSTDVIQIKEGAGAAVSLTNNRLSASNLSFQNLSRNNTPGVVRISFTLSYKTAAPTPTNEYQFIKTFYTSASIRR